MWLERIVVVHNFRSLTFNLLVLFDDAVVIIGLLLDVFQYQRLFVMIHFLIVIKSPRGVTELRLSPTAFISMMS